MAAGANAVRYTPLLLQSPDSKRPLGQSLVEFENNRLWITNEAYMDRFVDTSDANYVHLPPFKSRSLQNALKIVPSDRDNENCFIQNLVTQKFMFANETKEDSNRKNLSMRDEMTVYYGIFDCMMELYGEVAYGKDPDGV